MAWKASPLRKKAGLMRAPPANRIAIRTSSPSSHPPTSWGGIRPNRDCALSDMDAQEFTQGNEDSMAREGMIPPAMQDSAATATGSVFVALAALLDRVLGHQLRPGIQVRGGNAAVDLEIELHDRPEALQERLLAERASQVAAADGILLGRTEVEAIGADLPGPAHLGDGLGEGRREHVVGGEGADHVAARFEQRYDAVHRVLRIGIDTDILRSG